MLTLLTPAFVHARAQETTGPLPFVSVGSRDENRLRYLAALDTSRFSLWTIRPFTDPQAGEVVKRDSLFARPLATQMIQTGPAHLQRLTGVADLWYNTTYPFGWNDGAVWRGRGATGAIAGGFKGSAGPLEVTIDPMLWISENRAFGLMQPDSTGVSPFSNPQFAPRIDRPQRFGTKSYGGFDPGQSSVRLRGLGVTAGMSTENQWAGPMSEWPIILSNNAAGFPNVFAGSDRPWNIGIGKIHGRVFYGRLSQSAYANTVDTARTRVASGIMGVFAPSFISGLEIGAIRMFQYVWPSTGLGWKDLRKPFEAFLKEHVTGDPGASFNDSADNQIASVFARWSFPRTGFEFYGEFARDDHNWNARDAIVDPDHAAMYGMGFRKSSQAGGLLKGFTAEWFSFEPSILQRSGRAQNQVYVHHRIRQGDTEAGQNIGVGFAAINGGGLLLRRDFYESNGNSHSWTFTRMVMREQFAAPSVDVDYTLAYERTRRLRGIEAITGLTGVYEMNRYFSGDAGNVMLTLGARW